VEAVAELSQRSATGLGVSRVRAGGARSGRLLVCTRMSVILSSLRQVTQSLRSHVQVWPLTLPSGMHAGLFSQVVVVEAMSSMLVEGVS